MHLVLLGDSIFDNGAYTRGEPDVVSHLRRIVPPEWKATLLAIDGATTRGLASQRRALPADATHLFVSIGGNDALAHLDLLNTPVRSTAEALALFAERVGAFEENYREAVLPLAEAGVPVTLCTIYNGWFPDARERLHARTALALFNDVILRTAVEARFGILELRQICIEAADYANPIEPSGPGGLKIAQAIRAAVSGDRR
ncbi:MAG TPA: GDSL-type esterase/lipase family protein [Vicinamibacterales bacterium]|nr:GDSL-type esterase/lipase family protein [Vicinamibacterales bacterium]